MTEQEHKAILKKAGAKPIAHYKIHTQLTGKTTAGLLLSQIVYWLFRGKDSKIYKTDRELQEETGLTDGEMRGAKAILKKLPFLTLTREGSPARTYYQMDWIKYNQAVSQISKNNETGYAKMTKLDTQNSRNKIRKNHETRLAKITKQDTQKLPNKISKNNETLYTENTTKTTTENTTETTTINIVRQTRQKQIHEITKYLNSRLKEINGKEGKYRADSYEMQKLCKARLNEGYTVEDFKTVIDNMIMAWKNRPEMHQYLRPVTLFSPTKFGGYLNRTVTPADKGIVSRKTEKNIQILKQMEDL